MKSYRAFDRWGAEMMPLAGEYFRQTTKELMFGNKLYTGEFEIGGRRVGRGQYHGARSSTPWPSTTTSCPGTASRELVEKVGSEDKEEVVLKGGHVSLIAGAERRPPAVAQAGSWLSGAST